MSHLVISAQHQSRCSRTAWSTGAGIGELPNALEHLGTLAARLAGKQVAVFLDYDGTLTPIVDRPEDAVISESMREAVRGSPSAARSASSAAATARSSRS